MSIILNLKENKTSANEGSDALLFLKHHSLFFFNNSQYQKVHQHQGYAMHNFSTLGPLGGIHTPSKIVIEANVDSISFGNKMLPSIFHHDDAYEIVSGKRSKELWKKTFGKDLCQNPAKCPWKEAYIITCLQIDKLKLSLKEHYRYDKPILAIAGLERYDKKAKNLKSFLKSIWPKLPNDTAIRRIDVCIDFEGAVPVDLGKNIMKKNRIFDIFENTTYFNSAPKKKTKNTITKKKKNDYLKIIIYDKTEKDGVMTKDGKRIIRLEFQFSAQYLRNTLIGEYSCAIEKIEKTINAYTNLEVKVNPVVPPKLYQKTKCLDGTSNKSKNILETFKIGFRIWRKLLLAFKWIHEIKSKLDLFREENLSKLNSLLHTLITIEKRVNEINNNQSIVIQKVNSSSTKSDIVPKYLKTKDMAVFISVSESFLEKNMGGIFRRGVHFSRPKEARLLGWDVDNMITWRKGEESDEDKALIAKLLD